MGSDGSVAWLCLPRFDSPAVFAALVDARRGGSFGVAPVDARAGRQRYEPDSAVLVTEVEGPGTLVRLTDALALRDGADLREDAVSAAERLVRRVEVLRGPVRLAVDVRPRAGAVRCDGDGGLALGCPSQPDLRLALTSSRPLAGAHTELDLDTGDVLHLVLSWDGASPAGSPVDTDPLLERTVAAWRKWAANLDYEGPREELVRRSAITLKMLDHFENGALVAAPTSSLPEMVGGPRNWDYRYAWVRDAAFSVYALRRIGLTREAAGFLAWVLDSFEATGRAGVLYSLDGGAPPPEREDPDLEGYRRSAPVRWGNAAAGQVQHDAHGEILDCAYQWVSSGGTLEPELWSRLRTLVERAGRIWDTPDHGIWEVRCAGRLFTYSAAMCQVALDRGARLARRLGLDGDVAGWERQAAGIREAILERAWDAGRNALGEHLGGGGLDASLLALPLRRVVPADHPKMVATTAAVAERLSAGDGLLYRYRPEESPDGIPGEEGAFLLCSFWLVDNLAYQGRLDEALALFESLCARANPLGLLPEQIHPGTGEFRGNYPQAFSHVGLVSSGINLARRLRPPAP